MNVVELGSASLAVAKAVVRSDHLGRYGEALEMADEVIEVAPELPSAWRILAGSLEMLGRHEEAAAAVVRLLALQPFTLEWAGDNLTPFVEPDPWETYLSALGRAGVPQAGTL